MATTKTTTTKTKATVPEPTVSKAEVAENSAASASEVKVRMTPKGIDPNMIVTVRNGFQGTLVYISPKTGQTFIWDSFGAEQDMEISELRAARNSAKKFFEYNWFMFDEQWIIDYLGMARYYKNALPIDDFDSLFEKPADEVREIISKLSDGQKRSVGYRAKELIASGEIDSRKTVATLEECLGIELVVRD